MCSPLEACWCLLLLAHGEPSPLPAAYCGTNADFCNSHLLSLSTHIPASTLIHLTLQPEWSFWKPKPTMLLFSSLLSYLNPNPCSFYFHLLYPRLTLNSSCSQEKPSVSDISASIPKCYYYRHASSCPVLCGLGIKSSTLCMLSKHCTNWPYSPHFLIYSFS